MILTGRDAMRKFVRGYGSKFILPVWVTHIVHSKMVASVFDWHDSQLVPTYIFRQK